MVQLADNKRKFGSFRGVRIERQFACSNLARRFERENVEPGKQDGINDVGGRVQEEGVGILEKEIGGCRTDGHDMDEQIGIRKWRTEIERHSGGRRKDSSEEVPR